LAHHSAAVRALASLLSAKNPPSNEAMPKQLAKINVDIFFIDILFVPVYFLFIHT
jgi:hypothetical protein